MPLEPEDVERDSKSPPRKRKYTRRHSSMPMSGPKGRTRVALMEVENIVMRLMETHRYSPWMATEEAAKYLGRQPGTLRRWRSEGGGPVFHRISHKLIRYHVNDLDGFVRNGGGAPDEALPCE